MVRNVTRSMRTESTYTSPPMLVQMLVLKLLQYQLYIMFRLMTALHAHLKLMLSMDSCLT